MADQNSDQNDRLLVYYELREAYEKRFEDSFPSFKYANDLEDCIAALQKCLREKKPEEINDDGVVY